MVWRKVHGMKPWANMANIDKIFQKWLRIKCQLQATKPSLENLTDLSRNDISILDGWLAIPISITRCRTTSSTSGTAAHMAMVRGWPVSCWTTLAQPSTQQGTSHQAHGQLRHKKCCVRAADVLGIFWEENSGRGAERSCGVARRSPGSISTISRYLDGSLWPS